MHGLVLATVILAYLFVPPSSSANAIYPIGLTSGGWDAFVTIEDPESVGVPFHFSFERSADSGSYPLTNLLNGWNAEYVAAFLTSSTLISKESVIIHSGLPHTVYEFGAGEVQMDFVLSRPDSAFKPTGSFRAGVPAFSVSIRESDGPEIGEDSQCPCLEEMEVYFGEGKLDSSIARALGVSRRTIDGQFLLLAEQVDLESSDARHGVGYGIVGFRAVPEPSLVALLGVGAVCVLVRRKILGIRAGATG